MFPMSMEFTPANWPRTMFRRNTWTKTNESPFRGEVSSVQHSRTWLIHRRSSTSENQKIF